MGYTVCAMLSGVYLTMGGRTMCGPRPCAGVFRLCRGREGCAADDGDVRGRATICRVRGPWAEQSKQAAMFLDVTVSFA